MPVTADQRDRRIREELTRMNQALASQQGAYEGFLAAGRLFNWKAAAEYQLQASAAFDTVMDAYMTACRLMEEGDA